MKIIIKNLKQVQYNVEIESDEKTIKDLKNEIEKVHGFDSNLMKLLHNGVVLEDAKTLKDYNIKDENVIIMMNAKTKAKINPPQEQPPSSISPSNPIEVPKSSEESNKSASVDKVNSLVDMGYEKEKVEKALNAANGDINLAIEYLTSGNIPERNQQNQQNSNSGNNNTNSSNLPFELRQNASIIKIVCQRNPNKIFSILNNMKEKSPHLFNLIKQHEQEFKNLLVSPISQEDITIYRNFQQEVRGRRPGGLQIRLTKEESDAVKRLKELGNFSQAEVLQAFIACDKNEELTANYLFEQKLRDEETNKNNNNQNQDQGQGQ